MNNRLYRFLSRHRFYSGELWLAWLLGLRSAKLRHTWLGSIQAKYHTLFIQQLCLQCIEFGTHTHLTVTQTNTQRTRSSCAKRFSIVWLMSQQSLIHQPHVYVMSVFSWRHPLLFWYGIIIHKTHYTEPLFNARLRANTKTHKHRADRQQIYTNTLIHPEQNNAI